MSRPVLFLILFCLGVAWGGTIPLTKIAVSTGHHPLGLIFWQFLISAILLAGIAWIRKSSLPFSRSTLMFFLVVALIGTILPNGFSFWAAVHLPGGVLALVIALVPMFALVVALIIRVESFSFVRAGGVLLGAIGVALIVLPDTSLPDPSKVGFIFVGLIAPLMYGIEGNYVALKQPADMGPIAALLGASLVGIVIALPAAIAVDGFVNPTAVFSIAEWALVGSSVLHVVAYTGYLGLVRLAGPLFTAQVSYIVTPAGVIFSMIFLGEDHSPYIWMALVVLLFGLMLVQPKKVEEG